MPTKAKPVTSIDVAPDQRVLTRREAEYLAREAHVEIDALVDRPIAELDDILRWKIDPFRLLFRKVCGRVVRKDPVTGEVQGVPNATVHVLDTDTSFLGYFPIDSPYWWHWPLWHHTEEIGTSVTDACGNFCVWIPRWDIDRILRFRHRHVCFGDVFRPNIKDLLEQIDLGRLFPKPPVPNPPDPGPLDELGPLANFELHHLPVIAERLGDAVADQVRLALVNRTFGASTGTLTKLLQAPAFGDGLAPPLPREALGRLRDVLPDHVQERFAEVHGAPAKGKAKKGDAPPADATGSLFERLDRLDPRELRGPFRRCIDLVVPEWVPVFDVPDITFRVTQDVDLDGDEEVIYTEGLFDVRWDAGAMPPVVLQASAIARPSPFCEGPQILCSNTPAIRTVGLMPLEPTHHDMVTGLSTRVNRPRPPAGLSTDAQTSPAASPYAGTLQLHGCQRIGAATHYRLVYDHHRAGATTLTGVAFTGLEWWAPRLGPGAPFWIHPDPQGWYEILPAADLVFPNWLLNWESYRFANGRYDIHLELGNSSGTVLSSSPVVPFEVDNSGASGTFDEIRWGLSATGPFPVANRLPDVCPIIVRPPATDIFLQVRWTVRAEHLLEGNLTATGCGGGAPVILDPEDTRYHWHTGPTDNACTRTAIVRIPGTSAPGCYDLGIDAWSRAFNPAGDGGGPGTDWLVNAFYSGSFPRRGVAIIEP